MQKTTRPRMPTKALKAYGINRQVRRRALHALSEAGLISLETRANKNPSVQIHCVWLREREQSAATRVERG